MRGIVSDTAPLNYLVLIDAIEVLPRLYQRVLIPLAVKAELSAPDAPEPVRGWIAAPPSWLTVCPSPSVAAADLAALDAGEREAISLASELGAILLLMDERDGCASARSRGQTVIGTLSVLDAASAHSWIDLPTMFDRLLRTSFRSPRRLMREMLEQDGRRKARGE